MADKSEMGYDKCMELITAKEMKIDFSTICLIVVFITILAITIVSHIFYWCKGGYCVELVIAIITTCLAELVALCKLKLDKRKYEGKND